MERSLAATKVRFLALVLSFCQKLGLEAEIAYAHFRAFLLLSVTGFVLQSIFDQHNDGWIILVLPFHVHSSIDETPHKLSLLCQLLMLNLLIAGVCCWLCSRSTSETSSSWEVCGRCFHSDWNFCDYDPLKHYSVTTWGNDWSYCGRGFSIKGHSTSDWRHEYDYSGIYKQHQFYLAPLPKILHQLLPVRCPSLLTRISPPNLNHKPFISHLLISRQSRSIPFSYKF